MLKGLYYNTFLSTFEFIMGIFKTRKNKRFNYSPRYWDDKGEGNPYQMEHKFDKFRSTVGKSGNLKNRFSTAWDELKNHSDKKVNLRILWIFLILLFIFLYLIDFDLSIFFTRS
ncbi:riboflavin synthase subunit beta [Aquimarina celericrescens]|uniref:Riboflavin synthase subunit beta n=1 Tax=Aquimarina celericrescens TaxID=1964542 RepID=A0ABW5AWM4_9FLAO